MNQRIHRIAFFRQPAAWIALLGVFVLTAGPGRGQNQTPSTIPPAASAPNAAGPAQLESFAAKFAADTGIKLVLIPAGVFLMGDSVIAPGPSHQVTISRPFYLGATDVTQAQWTALMGDNPSHFKDDTRPVERVSWDDSLAFCKKLTDGEQAAGRLPAGWAFTLPTSAQWEYACRAGTTGDNPGNLDEMAWYDVNSDDMTHPVATKKPNAWGLYDMQGNVYQWCLDWYGDMGKEPETDPTGPATGSNRTMRGGAWNVGVIQCRSSGRNGDDHRSRFYYLGLRVALVSAPAAPPPAK